jgi:hypothetical protein
MVRLSPVRKLRIPARVQATASTPILKNRVLSPEARKKIADAQKKRWAAQKKTT